MKSSAEFFRGVMIIVGATIGVGIFSLPYVFATSGIILSLAYLLGICAAVIFAHTLYYRVVAEKADTRRLPELARKYLGKWGAWTAYGAIIGGFILGFVVLLIMGGEFLQLLIPILPRVAAIAVFWVSIAIPLVIKERDATSGEMWGTLAKCIAILAVAIFAPTVATPSAMPAFLEPSRMLMPFGSLLFALSAWTAMDQIARLRRKNAHTKTSVPLMLATGTVLSGALMLFFVSGVLRGSSVVAPDTIAGITAWPPLLLAVVGIVGLLGAWTVSISIGLELEDTLTADAHFPRFLSSAATLIIPVALLFLGLSDASPLIAFSGGVFVAAQYFLILSVSRKALRLKGASSIVSVVLEALFILAALSEIYYLMRGI